MVGEILVEDFFSSLIFIVFILWVTGIGGDIIDYAIELIARVRATGEPIAARKKQPSLKQQNMRKVVGWQAASQHELKTLSPKKLQALLDSRNPMSDRITQIKTALKSAELQGDDESAKLLRSRLKDKLTQVRMLRVDVQRHELGKETEDLMAAIDTELEHLLPRKPKMLPSEEEASDDATILRPTFQEEPKEKS
jgi:hypothetical protein